MPPRLTKAEVCRSGLPSKGIFQEVLLVRINIAKTKDMESPKIFKEKAATTALNALQLSLWPH